MDKYEEMARKYIEGNGGLKDLHQYEMVTPICDDPLVEGARWIIALLTLPRNRADLDALVEQSNLRMSPRGKIADSKGVDES